MTTLPAQVHTPDWPLLQDAAGPQPRMPRFDAIEPETVVPAMEFVLAQFQRELDQLEQDLQAGAAIDITKRVEWLHELLGRPWGIIEHLLSVQHTDALQAAQEAMQPKVVAAYLRLAQSKAVYAACKNWLADEEFDLYDGWQAAKLLARDAELAGVGLPEQKREAFASLAERLADLGTRFQNNVLQATRAFALDLHDAADVDGLPESLRTLLASRYASAHQTDADPTHGPWRVGLDFPSFGPFLQHSTRRDLRERLYRAYIGRATGQQTDNTAILREILTLRQQQAELLGFEHFAALSFASKAATLPQAKAQLESLLVRALPAGQQELAELQALAASKGALPDEGLRPWDVAYWAEQLRKARHDLDEEALRPYFPLPKVLQGIFDLCQRLFGIQIQSADGETPVWHPDVRFFRVVRDGEPVAWFFLDPYSRPANKRSGAWMNECLGRSRQMGRDGHHQLPVAYLVCNQSPPIGDQPSLMTFAELRTLLHELGHGLQHMLTQVDHGLISGIRGVEWDVVELPSQFMENWAYDWATVQTMSGHWQTAEPLPKAVFDKLLGARTFRAGSDMLRQLTFALTDLALHEQGAATSALDPFALYQQVAARTSPLPPLPDDRFLCSFSHIFAGGYAAGYYSYKWAEVLSADAFFPFAALASDDAAGLARLGSAFAEHVLGVGGAVPGMIAFANFRGRPPEIEPLLAQYGLVPAAA